MPNLKVGDKAPDFELPLAMDKTWKLSDTVGKQNIVVLFFPLAFSSTCHQEMCSFRDGFREVRGIDAIEKYFVLKDAGESGGLEWLEATPKSKDTTFERIRMGFKGDALVQMDLFDFFGQRTTLKLSKLERNPSIPASKFRFTPPKGADVIGD